MLMKEYKIKFANQPPEMRNLWEGKAWRNIPALKISSYRPESSPHHPETQCKLLYDEKNIYGIFRVDDKYVRSLHTEFQSPVYTDSCVEFFIQPKNSKGYFNFEFNCGGALLASFVTDPTRIGGSVRECTSLTPDDNFQIKRQSSLPRTVNPEITENIVWHLEFSIPFAVLEKYAGSLRNTGGQVWRANFYKCGNETSHPHWGSWAELSGLNFHLPADFGKIHFLPGIL